MQWLIRVNAHLVFPCFLANYFTFLAFPAHFLSLRSDFLSSARAAVLRKTVVYAFECCQISPDKILISLSSFEYSYQTFLVMLTYILNTMLRKIQRETFLNYSKTFLSSCKSWQRLNVYPSFYLSMAVKSSNVLQCFEYFVIIVACRGTVQITPIISSQNSLSIIISTLFLHVGNKSILLVCTAHGKKDSVYSKLEIKLMRSEHRE